MKKRRTPLDIRLDLCGKERKGIVYCRCCFNRDKKANALKEGWWRTKRFGWMCGFGGCCSVTHRPVSGQEG